MNKNTKQVTKKELNQLKKILEKFETQTVNETGVRQISGGFANANMGNYDNQWIDIELKWGIQSDCENTVHTEHWKISREILNSNKSVAEKVRAIAD